MRPNFERNQINNAACICTDMMTYYFALMQDAEPNSFEKLELDEKRAAWYQARELFKSLLKED